MAHRAIILSALGLAAVLLLVPAASAHATAYNTGSATSYQVKVVYGNLYEPVSTFQKTGLDLQFTDAKGNPISGLDCVDHDGNPVPSPKLTTLSLTYADQTLDMTKGCKAQFGKPGWYTVPYIYTKAGAYVLHVQGNVNGTALDMTVQPAHPIGDSSAEMFPVKVDTAEQSATKIAQMTDDLNALKARVNTLEGKSSKGAAGVDGGLMMLGVLAVLGLAASRRPGA